MKNIITISNKDKNYVTTKNTQKFITIKQYIPQLLTSFEHYLCIHKRRVFIKLLLEKSAVPLYSVWLYIIYLYLSYCNKARFGRHLRKTKNVNP